LTLVKGILKKLKHFSITNTEMFVFRFHSPACQSTLKKQDYPNKQKIELKTEKFL